MFSMSISSEAGFECCGVCAWIASINAAFDFSSIDVVNKKFSSQVAKIRKNRTVAKLNRARRGGRTDASAPAAPKIRMPDPERQPAVPVPGIRKEEGLHRPSSGIGERIAYFPRPIFSMRARVSGLWPRKRT